MTGSGPQQSSKSPQELDAYCPSVRSLSVTHKFSGDKLRKLDQDQSNWQQWHKKFLIALALNSLKGYVKGTVNKPDASTVPRAHQNWLDNDELALNLIFEHIDDREQEYVADAKTSKECWDILEKRHSNEGPMRQIQLMQEAMSVRFSPNSLATPGAKQCELARRVLAMGELTYELMASLFLLVGLSNIPHLRTTVNHNISNSTKENPYTVAQILRLLESEQRPTNADKASSSIAPSSSIALLAKTNHKPTSVVVCRNCKKSRHTAKFCISHGGGMEGKPIEESKQARRNGNTQHNNKPTNAPTSKPNGKTAIKLKDENGRTFVAYMDSFETSISTEDIDHPTAFAGIATDDTDSIQFDACADIVEYNGIMAFEELAEICSR